ncbi:MAG: hypothetical protein AB1497_09655 [Bacillota bacterium]
MNLVHLIIAFGAIVRLRGHRMIREGLWGELVVFSILILLGLAVSIPQIIRYFRAEPYEGY